MALYLKVPKNQAEKKKTELRESGVYDRSREMFSDKSSVFIPVKSKVKGEVVDLRVKAREKKPFNLGEAVSGVLTEEEFSLLPRSFDTIGSVAVISLPEPLRPKARIIAEALVRVHKHIKSVCLETGATEGEFRVRPIELILGDSTLTEYKESGVTMLLDVQAVYFTPRLASERLRIAKQVRPGEKVLVMFAGIGPYPLVIAKTQPKSEVVAVEINPEAVRFMEKNIEKNKMQDRIKAYLGDVREIVPKLGKFDRILMPLPKDAGNFLDVAKKAIKEGGIVHFYHFSGQEDLYESAILKIKEQFPDARILYKGLCGDIAPRKFRVVVDFSTK